MPAGFLLIQFHIKINFIINFGKELSVTWKYLMYLYAHMVNHINMQQISSHDSGLS